MERFLSPKVVLIGGGTGNAVFLRTLKAYTPNITAIVSVADDGGSSGKLRKEMGILPPGDIRNCIIALASEENTMAELMNFRFKEGFLTEQSFGNVLIAAMNNISDSFADAIKKVSKVLAITGRVLPVSEELISLCAIMSNGKMIHGESYIPKYAVKTKQSIDRIMIMPEDVKAFSECIDAIMNADIIVYSPGSLFTSLLPNLLVKDIIDALEIAKAEKYYIANIMTQQGETEGFSLHDHIDAIEKHTGGKNIIDTIVYNTESVPDEILQRYAVENAEQVVNDITTQMREKYNFLPVSCVQITSSIVRHDSNACWKRIFNNLEVD